MDYGFPQIKAHIERLMDRDDEHNRKYHANGANMCSNGKCHRQNSVKVFMDALKNRVLPPKLLKTMPMPVATEVELFIFNISSRDRRVAILEEMRREIGEERHERGKDFSRSQLEECVRMGLNMPTAVKVMHAASSTHMVKAVCWARNSLEATIGLTGANPYVASDALQALLMGRRGTNNMGEARVRDLLRAYQLPPVPVNGQKLFFDFLYAALFVICETDPRDLLSANREAVT